MWVVRIILMNNNECYLSELYSAIQGEGPMVGIRQIFLRFSICDLRCVWCDTPDSLVKNEFCNIETMAGKRNFTKIKNPISLNELTGYIKNLNQNLHHSISLTGGEPLLHYKFLVSFLPELKEIYFIPVYLETGGHRPDELKKIIHLVDYISLDFKLPTSAKAGILWDKHKEFLSLSLNAKNVKSVWIKIVITDATEFNELLYSVELVKAVLKDNKELNKVEIFLQPVTEINGSKPPGELELLEIHTKLLGKYPYIRVLPQVHKFIGQR